MRGGFFSLVVAPSLAGVALAAGIFAAAAPDQPGVSIFSGAPAAAALALGDSECGWWNSLWGDCGGENLAAPTPASGAPAAEDILPADDSASAARANDYYVTENVIERVVVRDEGTSATRALLERLGVLEAQVARFDGRIEGINGYSPRSARRSRAAEREDTNAAIAALDAETDAAIVEAVSGGVSQSSLGTLEVTGGATSTFVGGILAATGNGSLGVGTTTPGAKLAVAGSGLFSGNLTGGGWTADSSGNPVQFYPTSNSAVGLQYNANISALTVYGGALHFKGAGGGGNTDAAITQSGGTFTFGPGTSGNASADVIVTGSVGIGTTSPAAKLALEFDDSWLEFKETTIPYWGRAYPTIRTDHGVRFTDSTGSFELVGIAGGPHGYGVMGLKTENDFVDLTMGNDGSNVFIAGGQSTNFTLSSESSITLSPAANAHIKLLPTGTGNVGIGTTSPFTKLGVAGDAYIGGNLTATGTVTAPSLAVSNQGRSFSLTGDNVNMSFTGNYYNMGIKNEWWGGTINFGHDDSGTQMSVAGNGYDSQGVYINHGLAIGENYGALSGGVASALYPAPTNGLIVEGNVGIGTTSPYAKLSVHALDGGTATTLFAVASSTASATSTHFAVTNTGDTVIGSVTNSASNTGKLQVGGMVYASSFTTANANYFPVGLTINTTSISDTAGWAGGDGYLRLITNNSYGISLDTGSTKRLVVSGSTGNVGVATTTPASPLSVQGAILSSDLYGGATNVTVDANGNLIRDPSDASLKENVEAVASAEALEKVLLLRGVTFDWRDAERYGPQRELGFIAQEVREVIPEAVSEGGDYLSLSVKPIVAALVGAVQAVWARVETLAAAVDGMAAWFADAVTFQVPEGSRVQVDGLLCAGDTCVTSEQLEALLEGAGGEADDGDEPSPEPVVDEPEEAGGGDVVGGPEEGAGNVPAEETSTDDSGTGEDGAATDDEADAGAEAPAADVSDESSSEGDSSAGEGDSSGGEGSSDGGTGAAADSSGDGGAGDSGSDSSGDSSGSGAAAE